MIELYFAVKAQECGAEWVRDYDIGCQNKNVFENMKAHSYMTTYWTCL